MESNEIIDDSGMEKIPEGIHFDVQYLDAEMKMLVKFRDSQPSEKQLPAHIVPIELETKNGYSITYEVELVENVAEITSDYEIFYPKTKRRFKISSFPVRSCNAPPSEDQILH